MKVTEKQILQRLIAADGVLNMHDRAEKAGKLCQLNGQRRTLRMDIVDCGSAACLHGSCMHIPWFKQEGYPETLSRVGDGGDFDDEKLREFWGPAYDAITTVYGFGQDSFGQCLSGPYKGKRLVHLSNDDVRAPLRVLIRKYGGQEAIDECERRRAEGDKLGYGISDVAIPTKVVPQGEA